jgi:hypothetical protein
MWLIIRSHLTREWAVAIDITAFYIIRYCSHFNITALASVCLVTKVSCSFQNTVEVKYRNKHKVLHAEHCSSPTFMATTEQTTNLVPSFGFIPVGDHPHAVGRRCGISPGAALLHRRTARKEPLNHSLHTREAARCLFPVCFYPLFSL